MHKSMSGIDAKEAREAATLSQAAVATALGLNRTYYSLFESGRLTLTDDQQVILQRVLGNRRETETTAEMPGETVLEGPHRDATQERPRIHCAGRNSLASDSKQGLQASSRRLEAIEKLVATEQVSGRRVAPAIARALNSLRSIEYPELLELASQRQMTFEVLPTFNEYRNFDTDKRHQVEMQLEQALLCHALYGERWLRCNRQTLYKAVCELRAQLPGGKLVEFPSILEEFLESDREANKTTSRLRLETAASLVRAALNRINAQVLGEH